MKQHVASASGSGQVFLARAPILTRKGCVLGYQLRVGRRTGPPPGDGAGDDDVSQVTRVIGAVGVETLTQGQAAFVRVTRANLLDGTAAALPARDVVLEVGADVEADSTVRAACATLKAGGHRLALDDFEVTGRAADLAALADYLEVDVSDPRSAATRARTVACFRRGVTALIAKGVETLDQVEAASRDGFVCFQGFFFERPQLQAGRPMSPQHVTTLRFLRALNNQNLSLGHLEDLIKHDTELCYRILRAVNSAAFARRTTVGSIREALLLLGRDMVRRWASIWAVAGLSAGAHGAQSELVAMSTVRARLCELLAGSAHGEAAAGEAFLLGMCSLLDAILSRPMAVVSAELPLNDETRRALCGEPNAARELLDCVIAYERGAWPECEALAQRARVNPALLPGAFLEALRWSREFQSPAAAQPLVMS